MQIQQEQVQLLLVSGRAKECERARKGSNLTLSVIQQQQFSACDRNTAHALECLANKNLIALRVSKVMKAPCL
jgi:hypothetical protein